jgi:pimeloyl-ACP methyl ester carboxylesterase
MAQHPDTPVCFIAGELDRVDSVETLRTQLLPHIPHARMHVVPRSGHLSPLEAPLEVAGFIQESMVIKL